MSKKSVEKAIELISEITPANGYVFTPSTVGTELTDRPRAVKVESVGKDLLITIAAEGIALEYIKGHIAGVVGPVTFTDEQTMEVDHATTETNQNDRGQD